MQICHGIFKRAYIAAHNNGRILGGHNNSDQHLSVCRSLWSDIADERRRETHTTGDMIGRAIGASAVQLLLQGSGLLARNAYQGRAADEIVATPELGNNLGRGLASTIDVFNVDRDII